MKQQYDLLIIGGGMAGASLALALRHSGLRIAVVEAVASDASQQPSYDARAIALSHGSQRILDGMGLWQAMAAETVTPIRRIQVSDRGHFGRVRIDATEEQVDALGYVVEAAVLGRVLQPALQEQAGIALYCPAQLQSLEQHSEGVHVTVQCNDELCELSARLLVAADGGNSTVASLLGGRYLSRGYGQSAIIANVVGEREHDNMAHERFTDSGPLALLPNRAPGWMAGSEAGDCRWSLVWTVRDAQLEHTLALDDADFLAALQQRLGRRIGRILSTGPRSAYPLGLRYLHDHVQQRVVFVGNAAHTIHPVAGQGLNLGLRDVAALSEVIEQAAGRGEDIGSSAVLAEYKHWRRPDYLRVMAMTDSLARGFASNLLPLVVARNLGMVGMDLLPPLRRVLTRQMMGLNGRQSRLARGA